MFNGWNGVIKQLSHLLLSPKGNVLQNRVIANYLSHNKKLKTYFISLTISRKCEHTINLKKI